MALPLLIGDLPTIAGSAVDVDTDYLPIVDASVGADGTASKIMAKELIANTSSFVQSGIAAPLTAWTVEGKLRELFVSAADSAAATVAGKIDAAIAGAAGRIVFIPPTMGAGEATTYSVSQPVIDLRAGTVALGSGGKIVLNFEDAGGFIRLLVMDDQTSPTLSANAAALFNHRPTGTLPSNSTGEGAHCVGQTTGALLNSPTSYILSGVEGGANISSTGGTIGDVWGITANCQTSVGSTTNVTRLVSLYAQAPSKAGTGTISNVYTIVAETPTAAATSDNYSLWAKGAVRIGPRDTGSVNAALDLDGGNASSTGVVITLLRNGTPTAQIATEGAVLGGASSDLLINKVTSGLVNISIASVVVGSFASTGLTVTGAFGCNTKAAQTAYASGGALNAYGAGANGLDSGANMSAMHALVVNMRAALVANGIMS